MPFDFPSGPAIGQIVTASNGANYRWDGTKWAVYGPPPSTVQSFNARTGAVLLAQGDVGFALGYTAYDAANPAHYIEPGGFDKSGTLYLPGGRGIIRLKPGDYIGVDHNGWPIVVSNQSIADGSSSWAHS